tara:strand:- start:852 stop:1055 length:204 start_codon:yes stop_codon:yes gene_type:complete
MVVVLYKSSVSAAKKIMALREINYDKDKHMLVKETNKDNLHGIRATGIMVVEEVTPELVKLARSYIR